jgi:hypothetical protein
MTTSVRYGTGYHHRQVAGVKRAAHRDRTRQNRKTLTWRDFGARTPEIYKSLMSREDRRRAGKRRQDIEAIEVARLLDEARATIARLRAITPEVTVNYPLPFRDPQHRELYF